MAEHYSADVPSTLASESGTEVLLRTQPKGTRHATTLKYSLVIVGVLAVFGFVAKSSPYSPRPENTKANLKGLVSQSESEVGKPTCRTTDGDACVFPFRYEEVTFHACAKVDHVEDWCCTEIDSSGACKSGKWGNCGTSCEKDPCTTTTGVPCVFPFKYEEVTYNSCTTADHDRPWCFTEINSNSAGVPGKWEECASSCFTERKPTPRDAALVSFIVYDWDNRVAQPFADELFCSGWSRKASMIKYGESTSQFHNSWSAMMATLPGLSAAQSFATGADAAELWTNSLGDCILGFRGSDDGKDFIADISFSPTHYKGLAGVGQGIVLEFEQFLPTLKQGTDEFHDLRECSSLAVTGHSLGGALASVFSALANKVGDPLGAGITVDSLYTFGPIAVSSTPLENDKAEDKCFQGGRYFNIGRYFGDASSFSLADQTVGQQQCEYSCADFSQWLGTSAGDQSGTAMFKGELKHPKVASWMVRTDTGRVEPAHNCSSAATMPTGSYSLLGFVRLHGSPLYAKFVRG